MAAEEESEEFDQFAVSAEEAGLRIDLLLTQHYAGLQSRRYFQRLILEDKVLVNDKPISKKDRLHEGAVVSVAFSLSPELTLEPEDLPLDILWEDSYLAVINKPAGMVVHPAPGNWRGTIANALMYRYGLQEEGAVALRPGIVHRLDKDTSGVLVVAKSLQAHHRLVQLFSDRKVEKHYLALTCGNPGEGSVDAPIGRHPKLRKQMTVDLERGRQARTLYRTLRQKENLALVDLHLITGRTHQIRVHMKYLGFPILGDAVYGSAHVNKRWGAKRQMLHAHRMKMPHPFTEEPLAFTAPLPNDMSLLIQKHLSGGTLPCV